MTTRDHLDSIVVFARDMIDSGHLPSGALGNAYGILDAARLALEAPSAPSSPGDGWVMVPIVPRDEMVRAGDAVLAQSTWPDADDIWTAMIDARPLPTEGEG